jgi:site-specific DNA-methyltransferase (adenine-specific)
MTRGASLSDVWDDISPVRHGNRKHRRANELPMLIPARAIDIGRRPNGLVVDPFAGAGTVALAARAKGMRFIAGDIESQNTDLICERIAQLGV